MKMKKNLAIVLSIVLALGCMFAIGVYATDGINQAAQKTTVNRQKNYYAYYNSNSQKGAVAFCLDNAFTTYGTSTSPLKLCTKNADGTYTTLYEISRDNLTTWFYGKTEHSVQTGDDVASLLGGLSGIGITLESNKTNFAFALKGQPIERGKEYFLYIPEDFYADANGTGNAGAYLTIDPTDINAYTGDLIEDLKTATSSLYDAVLFAAESVGGIIF